VLWMRAVIGLCAVLAVAAPTAHAEEPFYKGKRLNLLINFAAGGPSDIEGRLLVSISSSISTGRRTSLCRIRTAPAD
jgi:tripartite-type tricarboxylate transporter receptor subunit TctC